jgi:hypothetical protein
LQGRRASCAYIVHCAIVHCGKSTRREVVYANERYRISSFNARRTAVGGCCSSKKVGARARDVERVNGSLTKFFVLHPLDVYVRLHAHKNPRHPRPRWLPLPLNQHLPARSLQAIEDHRVRCSPEGLPRPQALCRAIQCRLFLQRTMGRGRHCSGSSSKESFPTSTLSSIQPPIHLLALPCLADGARFLHPQTTDVDGFFDSDVAALAN